MAEKEKNKAKHKVTGLKVNEISFVDNPAVPGAKFVIEKRKGGEGEMPETVCDACGSAVELEKHELTSKQGEAPINFLQRAVGNLMAVRRSLPRAVRELLMALDMAADDVIQNGSDPDTAKAYIDRAAEEKNEKGKKQQDCPEGMEWDPAKGECVPKEKAKKGGHEDDKPKEEEKKSVEKKEEDPVEKKEEEKPENQVEKKEEDPVEKKEEVKTEEKSPDPQTGVGGLEFDAEQSAEIVKLLGRYPQ